MRLPLVYDAPKGPEGDSSLPVFAGGARGIDRRTIGRGARAAFHAFLRDMLAHGLGRRLMFGTDEMAWPDTIQLAVESVNSAEFLTAEQKADIFYHNAVRSFGAPWPEH
jgi:hypothetical protein